MAERIAGFFRTCEAAEDAEQELLLSGFPLAGIRLVAGDAPVHDTPAVGPLESIGAESEAGEDALIGGAAGFAAGIIAAALPGIGGPLIAAGPMAGAIGGLTGGAAAGGVIGWLRDRGIPEDGARPYAKAVRRRGAMLTVESKSAARSWLARKIFQDHGAIDVEDLADRWSRIDWPSLEREKVGSRQ